MKKPQVFAVFLCEKRYFEASLKEERIHAYRNSQQKSVNCKSRYRVFLYEFQEKLYCQKSRQKSRYHADDYCPRRDWNSNFSAYQIKAFVQCRAYDYRDGKQKRKRRGGLFVYALKGECGYGRTASRYAGQNRYTLQNAR